jgi:4-hydroxy-tetrahydrodipicolinate synthase
MKRLFGTGVALITPFDKSGSVDYASFKKVLQHTATGVDYYVVMGTTGESVTMSKEEKKAVLEFVLSNNPSGLPIVYGIGGNNTAEVVSELANFDASGVSAILSVSPYYNKPSQEGIYRHFMDVADASPRPVVLYNVPGRTASNITADTTLRLAEHSNIAGIKEASGNLEQVMKIARDMPEDFLLTSGDDMLTVFFYSIGGAGVISVLANALPGHFQSIKEACTAKDVVKANTVLYQLLDINGPMYEEGSPAGVKYLMSLMGLCTDYVRLPHVSPSAGLQKRIATHYEAFKQQIVTA